MTGSANDSTFSARWFKPWRKRGKRIYAGILGILFFALCARIHGQAPAQNPASKTAPGTAPGTAQLLSSYDGQNVTSIEVAGHPELAPGEFSSLFVQRAGEPFSKQKLDQTVAAIERTGKFKQVQIEVEPEVNGVSVLLVLQPAVYFGVFRFPGAKRFAYSQLVQASNYPPEEPYNANDIAQDRISLLKFFEQQGFFEAQVRPQVQVDAARGLANVTFHVTLNRHARFGEIQIEGTTAPAAVVLNHDLQTLFARVRGAAIRPGKSYRLKTVNNATQYLETALAKQGRLAAQVKLLGAQYNVATNRADIRFHVETGPVVHLRIEGAHLWSWTRKSLLPVYQGVGVDQELVQEGQQDLISYFEGKGYFDATVKSQFQKQASSDTIVYQIAKEKKHKVLEVAFAGNRHLSSADLLSHVTVDKSHFFSRGKYSQQLVRASAKNIAGVYQSEGYSSVKVTPDVVNHGADIRVRFQIDEGPQDTVASLAIDGADTFPKAKFAPKGLQLAPGRPYSQKLVEEDRQNIMANYLEAGYLTANFRETAAAVSKSDPHQVKVVYHIYEGPQVFTADVITLGRERTRQRLIDRDVASIKTGQPLTEKELLTSESNLYNHPGVFDWAEVDPARQITTQTKENVLVKVHEADRNQLTYGFGFEIIDRGGSVPSGTVALPNLPPIGLPSNFTTSEKTFYGPRGTIEYTRNNFDGKGESLSFTAFAGILDQRGAAYYIDPNFLWSKWKSTLSLSVDHDGENPIFSSQEEIASYQLQRSLNRAKTTTFFERYSYSETNLTRLEIPALVPASDLHVRLSTISTSITHDTRDNALDAHKGVFQTAELDFNSTKLGGSVDFAKLTLQDAYYKKIPANIIWANSIRIGLAQPFAGSYVPLSEEFFTGGGSTLRGFPLDGAGPQREVPVCSSGSSTDCTLIQVPSGGNELLILNSELRIPLPFKKGLGLVTFYDGGNVFPDVGFHDFTSLYSNNVGLGLRYATPVGPVRVDLGRNLNPVPGIDATQYFISIGQAF